MGKVAGKVAIVKVEIAKNLKLYNIVIYGQSSR